MLPFDNKSEFQVIVDMPEGTTLEETARVTPRDGGRDRCATRGGRRRDLCRRRRSLQFQRPGAALLSLRRGANIGRHPDQPRCRKDERRRRATTIATRSARARADRRRDTARASRWRRCPPGPPVLADAGGRNLRPDDERPALRWRRRCADLLAAHRGRGRYRLVRRRRSARRCASSSIRKRRRSHGISRPTMSATLRIAVGGDDGRRDSRARTRSEDVILLDRDSCERAAGIDLLTLCGPLDRRPAGRRVPLGDLVRMEQSTREARASTTRT